MNNQSFCCDGGDLQLFTDLGAQSATDSAPALYFYHPDHLASTAMVTDLDGRITQNVVYIPYGEVFVEERNGSWASSYLFNAKELDEETGLYYYGARYLDPAIALWLSTDPLQGKYPGMSPYNYCAGNPVKLVDPDGEDWIENQETGTVQWDKNVTSKETTPKGFSYLGQTCSVFNEAGDIMYGAQNGKTYDCEMLPEITVQGKMSKHAFDMMCAREMGIYQAQRDFLNHDITQGVISILSLLVAPEFSFFSKANSAYDASKATSTIVSKGKSLGYARSQYRNWLKNVGNLDRKTLHSDLEKAGFKMVHDGPHGTHFKHIKKPKYKIRLDPPDNVTKFNHMHINVEDNKHCFDKMLNPVKYTSPDAHIPIK